MVNRQPRGSEMGGQFAPNLVGSYKTPTVSPLTGGVGVSASGVDSIEGSWVAYQSSTGGAHTNFVEDRVVEEVSSPRVAQLVKAIEERVKRIAELEEWVEAQELKGKNEEEVFRVEETIHFEQELLDDDRDELLELQ